MTIIKVSLSWQIPNRIIEKLKLHNSPANIGIEDKQVLRAGSAEGTVIRRVRSIDHIAEVTLRLVIPVIELGLSFPGQDVSGPVNVLLSSLHNECSIVIVGFLMVAGN